MNIPEEIRWKINLYNTHPLAALMKEIIRWGNIDYPLHIFPPNRENCLFWPAYTTQKFVMHYSTRTPGNCEFCKRIEKIQR